MMALVVELGQAELKLMVVLEATKIVVEQSGGANGLRATKLWSSEGRGHGESRGDGAHSRARGSRG
jgi:hypothetical protein